MCHLQARIVYDPVNKILRKLYLRCLSCTWIVFSVKYRDEPGQKPCENRENVLGSGITLALLNAVGKTFFCMHKL